MKKIYLAGSISGRSHNDVVRDYEDKITSLIAVGYSVLCPMTGKSYLRTEIEFKSHGYDGFPVSTNHAIFERDKWMVENCDLLLADLSVSGDRVSIGTMMELAWASMLGKHTISVLPKGNIHMHAFVLEASDIVFENYDDAINYLVDLYVGDI